MSDQLDLTSREFQVLTGMSRGLANLGIARELGLSDNTVKTHARRLFRTLGASDRAHAVAIGYQRGLLGSGTDEAPVLADISGRLEAMVTSLPPAPAGVCPRCRRPEVADRHVAGVA